MINHCSFGHRWVERGCMECLIAQIDELRFRVQALEQNTVPVGSAKQKPREWWLDPQSARFFAAPFSGFTPDSTRYIRVREVLDD